MAGTEVQEAVQITLLTGGLEPAENDRVRVEQAPNVLVGERPRVRRIPESLDPIVRHPFEGVGRGQLIDQEDPAAGPCHASELRDQELGSGDVVKRSRAGRKVECPLLEGQREHVSLDEGDVFPASREQSRLREKLRHEIDRDDFARVRGKPERQGAGSCAGVQDAFGTNKPGEPSDAIAELVRLTRGLLGHERGARGEPTLEWIVAAHFP